MVVDLSRDGLSPGIFESVIDDHLRFAWNEADGLGVVVGIAGLRIEEDLVEGNATFRMSDGPFTCIDNRVII